MNNNKNGFLNWLMYAILFFCFGWVAFIGWGVYNLFKVMVDERENERIFKNKLHPDARPDIREMNTKEYYEKNLTKDEIAFIMSDPEHIRFVGRLKNGEAKYQYVNIKVDYGNKGR